MFRFFSSLLSSATLPVRMPQPQPVRPPIRPLLKFGFGLVAVLPLLHADMLTITGTINPPGKILPAISASKPDDVPEGIPYIINLSFEGSIDSLGRHELTGTSMLFNVTGAPEKDEFGTVSLTVEDGGDLASLRILACLETGSGCGAGNELDLNFMIPSKQLHGQSVPTQLLPGFSEFALFEDDGATEIHGHVTNYSYTGSPVPEPSALVFVAGGLIAVVLKRRKS